MHWTTHIPHLAAAVLLLTAPLHAAPVYEPVAGFELGPYFPDQGRLHLHTDGNFYGVSPQGGAYGQGTVYRVSPAGSVSVVVHFTGAGTVNKGASPTAGLAADGSGQLWGTTLDGGANFSGTIFRLDPATGVLTTVVEFSGNGATNKGARPYSPLYNDGAGHFWGTTQQGGAFFSGTVFKINIATGVLTTVIEFTDSGAINKGSAPNSGLTPDGSGSLWGTTYGGGTLGYGTVYKINPATGVLTTLVEFTDSGTTNRGWGPQAGLTADGAGHLWGTTVLGAAGYGTVFKVNIATGVLTTLAEFTDNLTIKGANPVGGLTADGTGRLWGTTLGGGTTGRGTIYHINTTTGLLTTVVNFTGNTGVAKGSSPFAGLVSDGANNLWGTTFEGGASGNGTVFKINTTSNALTTLAEFLLLGPINRGRTPQGELVSDGAGHLWGTTQQGGANGFGTVFKINLATGVQTTVAEFTGNAGTTKGALPVAGLYNDGAGNLWGSTSGGGTGNNGTLFKINTATGVLTTVIEFTGLTGARKGRVPQAKLISDGAGNLWGTTQQGGATNNGTIFNINTTTNTLTTVLEFSNNGATNKGARPAAALLADASGNFWGTTEFGGASGAGTVFTVNISSSLLTTVIEFTGDGPMNKGRAPTSSLISHGGYFWGTTAFGGALDHGTVFKLDPDLAELTTVLEFTDNGPANKGANPTCGLVSDGADNLWGTTREGGTGDHGTIFSINASSGLLTTVTDFTLLDNPAPGRRPGQGNLLRHSDGHFYGSTLEGGRTATGSPAGAGQIFRIRFGPTPVTLPATPVAATTATLRGTLNPNGAVTAASFEYGTSPILAGATVVNAGDTSAATTPQAVSAALTNLTGGTTYYFRVRGLNSENTVLQTGAILSFTTQSADGDSDDDGLPDSWEILYWSTIVGHAATDDDDHDGLVELLEYALGLNPTLADTAAQPTVTTEDGYLTVTLTKREGVTYEVQTGETLHTGQPGSFSAASTTVLINDATTLKVRDNVTVGTPPGRFLRTRVLAVP